MRETTRPNYRRSRRRRHWMLAPARHMNNIIVAICLIMLIAGPIACVISSIHFDISSRESATEMMEHYDGLISKVSTEINGEMMEEDKLAVKLYTAVNKAVRAQNDEVLTRLSVKVLPSSEIEFKEDITGNLITLYAFIKGHDSIRYDVGVAQALYDLDIKREHIQRLLESYNMYTDSYTYHAKEFNDTLYCKIFKSKRVMENKYNIVSLEVVDE